MRVLYMGNNVLGLRVLQWLTKSDGDEVVGLVLNSPIHHQIAVQEIRDALPKKPVFFGNDLRLPKEIEKIVSLRADIGVSVLFGHILKQEFLDVFPAGVINVHPALLPWNRGAMPCVWSIIDETPAGVTIHYIDEGIDTGDIIAQAAVPVRPTDTSGDLYARAIETAFHLFVAVWPAISSGIAPRRPQCGPFTFHRVADIEREAQICPEERYTARHLINILRALTHPTHPGAMFIDEKGKRVRMRLELKEE